MIFDDSTDAEIEETIAGIETGIDETRETDVKGQEIMTDGMIANGTGEKGRSQETHLSKESL